MKKKILIAALVLIILTSIFCFAACKKDFQEGRKLTIDNLNDLSIIMGKGYYYPAKEDNIVLIQAGDYDFSHDYAEIRYYEDDELTPIEIYVLINNIPTTVRLARHKEGSVTPSDDSFSESELVFEKINIGRFEVSKRVEIPDNPKTYGRVQYYFRYNNMSYSIEEFQSGYKVENPFGEESTQLTDENIMEYAAAIEAYIVTFKIYE